MNKEYIEREALLERLSYNGPMNLPPMEYYREVVTKFPAADVAPVRHGEWMEEWGQSYLVFPMKYDADGLPILQDYVSYVCSECGRKESKKHPYCNCGARMDGGNVND